MNMHTKYDWFAHYKAVQKRIATAKKKDTRPARERLAARLYEHPIGPPRVVLVDPMPIKPPPKITARQVLHEVAREFNVPFDVLTGPRRTAPIMAARMKAYYRLREEVKLSFPEIGRRVGGRDHTSALSGYRKFKRLLDAGEVVL